MLGHQHQRVEQQVVAVQRQQSVAGERPDRVGHRTAVQHHQIAQVGAGQDADGPVGPAHQDAAGAVLPHRLGRLAQAGGGLHEQRRVQIGLPDAGHGQRRHLAVGALGRQIAHALGEIAEDGGAEGGILGGQRLQRRTRDQVADALLDRDEAAGAGAAPSHRAIQRLQAEAVARPMERRHIAAAALLHGPAQDDEQ